MFSAWPSPPEINQEYFTTSLPHLKWQKQRNYWKYYWSMLVNHCCPIVTMEISSNLFTPKSLLILNVASLIPLYSCFSRKLFTDVMSLIILHSHSQMSSVTESFRVFLFVGYNWESNMNKKTFLRKKKLRLILRTNIYTSKPEPLHEQPHMPGGVNRTALGN